MINKELGGVHSCAIQDADFVFLLSVRIIQKTTSLITYKDIQTFPLSQCHYFGLDVCLISLHCLVACQILIFTGREKHLIQANDHDNNQQIFLYDTFDPGSKSNTLVPLSYDKFCQYNSIGGTKVLEKERLYYKHGREKDNGDIMKQDIGHKIVVFVTSPS